MRHFAFKATLFCKLMENARDMESTARQALNAAAVNKFRRCKAIFEDAAGKIKSL